MSDSKVNIRYRNVCFTINNPTDDDYKLIIDNINDGIKYCIMGWEQGENGTKHIQGYLELKSQLRMNSLKEFIPRAHIEARRGSQKQAIDYCKKDGDYEEHGCKKAQGARQDIKRAREIIDSTGSMLAVTDEINSYQACRFAELRRKYIQPQPRPDLEVTWIHGPTGVGKTTKAVEIAGGYDKLWMSDRNLQWWEGYDAHESVVIDDFRADFCTFHELLRIIDKTPYRAMVKGGSCPLKTKKIIITSPYPPELAYKDRTMEDTNQLLRRITHTIHMTQKYDSEVGGNTNPSSELSST